MLLVPHNHVSTIYELTVPEHQAPGRWSGRLLTGLQPDGFNIGFNDGLEAEVQAFTAIHEAGIRLVHLVHALLITYLTFMEQAGRRSWKRAVVALLLFGTAFGYLEAAVVSYLRVLHEPARLRYYARRPPGDLFPLLTLDQLRTSGPVQTQTLPIEGGVRRPQ